jgi:hypothetical protein
MNIDQFAKTSDLSSQPEVDRVCYLAYFYSKTSSVGEFSTTTAAAWLKARGFADVNKTRLADRLRNSEKTMRSGSGFALALKFIEEMNGRFPELSEKSQAVIDDGTILPEPDYQNTRGYIEKIAKQINAAYEQNIFDGCAVLMRRLVEILLILSYQKLGIDAEIKDSNANYLLLDGIVTNAKANTTLNLSRNGKTAAETFRTLGNFSAHKIDYTCKREYIKPEIQNFRALVSELLHKAGILL